jgi:hypothetical protein
VVRGGHSCECVCRLRISGESMMEEQVKRTMDDVARLWAAGERPKTQQLGLTLVSFCAGPTELVTVVVTVVGTQQPHQRNPLA